MMSTDNDVVFTGTFEDSSHMPDTGGFVVTTAGVDEEIDWTTDCIGDGSDMMVLASSANDYDDDNEINDEVRAMLEADDFLDSLTDEFESRFVNSDVQQAEVPQHDANIMKSRNLDAVYNISVGQPTCETSDKLYVEYFPKKNSHVNGKVFQPTSPLKRRGVTSGRGPSHRTLKKKSKGLPKRPLSKYNLFFQSERLKILDEATQNRTRISFENLAKTIGKRWHDLSEEENEKFRILSEQDIVRYREEMKIYHAKLRSSKTGTPSPSNREVDELDDTIVSSNRVRKTPPCLPKSPSTPRRKRKYSEGSVTTSDSIESSPSGKAKLSPTLRSKNNGHVYEATIAASSSTETEASSFHENVVSGVSRNQPMPSTKAEVVNEVHSGNEDDEITSFHPDLQLPLLQDNVKDDVESTPQPLLPTIHQRANAAKSESQLGMTQESRDCVPQHTPSLPHEPHCHYPDGSPNATGVPPPRIVQPWTYPMGHVKSHLQYPRPVLPTGNEPHPYVYGNTLPPPPPLYYRPLGHNPRLQPHYSYYRQSQPKFRPASLPLDHNKQVAIHDPQTKRERLYTIQYKCYAMKRSEAHAYLSRVSSTSGTPRAPGALSSSSFSSPNRARYSISMEQLLKPQYPIPGVEVDLSKRPMAVPLQPLPPSSIRPPPPHPRYYPHHPPPPPPVPNHYRM